MDRQIGRLTAAKGGDLGSLKRHVGRTVYRLLAPRVSRAGGQLGNGQPIVAGFLSTPSGLGESARLCYSALESLGLSPQYFDFGRRFARAAKLDAFSAQGIVDWRAAGPLIVHANPPELPAVCFFMGKRALAHRFVVGYWAWELETIPPAWMPGFRYVHEVWTPSHFAAEAIRPFTDKPVRVVPHPLSPVEAKRDRQRFGLAERDLLVLCGCDLRSSVERKNLEGNIKAFRTAFGEADDVALLIKMGGAEAYPELANEIETRVDSLNNVRLMSDVLSADAMVGLIATADIILSLHRSEGFGLLPAQAMVLGKPTIATYWSGNMDYMAEGA
ncbi:MAG: glycosyltransferase, partial [Alphaproteobacteria bacterium]|nr:glycosyltransferase [Alphaproteobacteria bacterium]